MSDNVFTPLHPGFVEVPDDDLEHDLEQPKANGSAKPNGAAKRKAKVKSRERRNTAKPLIRLQNGRLVENLAEAIDALEAYGLQIFDRGGQLVRPVRFAETSASDGVKRPPGALVLRPIDPDWLRLRLSDAADFEKWDSRADDFVTADPSTTIARTIIAAPDEGNWPHLRAIARHPLLTLDGRRIEESGYDVETGVLVDLEGEWPALPKNPTRDDAIAARARTEHLVRHFPFVSAADLSAGISMLMTPLQRPVLPTAPGHGVDAPAPGTGKSLLVDGGAILATGSEAPVLEYGADAEEAAKRLDGALLAGDTIIALDNIEAPVEGAALCQMLTQQMRRIRPLGSSIMANVPCAASVTFNGNNLTLRGDIVRRVVVARLDAGCEQPELREFDQDFLGEVRARRGEIVRDLQTIMAAYIRAGRPRVDAVPLGSFGDWSNTVRNALIWCGAADPVAVMERSRREDPRRQAARAVLETWYGAMGSTSVPLSAVILAAETVNAELREALHDVSARNGKLDAAALGRWCRSNRDVQAGKLVLRQDVTAKRANTHWLVEAAA